MAAPDSIRVLIVDDEAPARQRLADLLHKDPQIAEMVEAADGISAVDAIQSRRPNWLFSMSRCRNSMGLG